MARVAATHRATRRCENGTDATHGFPGHGVPPIVEIGTDVLADMIDLNRANSIMPKSSRFSGGLQSRIPRIARRLRSRMNELGLNQTELSARCTGAAQDLFPEQHAPQITRERIAKILMHCKANPGKSAARVISHAELQVLAHVLQVSTDWLTGTDESRDLILWDPLADPQRAHHILHLINDHEDKANEVLVWAEYLICSLETPEFMHKHHEALFSELDMLGAHDEKRKVVQIYDSIGNARRKRLFDSKQKRRKLVQFIFASDLEGIAQGKGVYAGIRKELRKSCLENLSNLLSDPSIGIDLMTIKDEEAARLRTTVRDYDSVGVFDESLVLWRYHSGRVAWSENIAYTSKWRKTLNDLRVSSPAGGDVLRFIRAVADSVR